MRIVVTGLLLLAACAAEAREIVVRPGVAGEPVLANAIAVAAPGDVIRLASGLYRECVTINKSLTLEGERGTILDPSAPFAVEWRRADDLGPGVFRASVARKPATLFLGGRVLAEIDERRTGEPGPWFWKTLLAKGPPLSGYRFIRAIWIYRGEEHAVYLHLEHEADPASFEFSAVWGQVAIVTFSGATDAAIRGLTLMHGYNGASFVLGARRCTVANCTIGPWDKIGIDLRTGATECVAEHNEIFRGSFEDWTPVDLSKERYEIWQVHKRAGFYDRVGIDLVRAGAGNRIHANHIYETFDGIDVGDSAVESLDKPLTRPDDDRDTEIWDNVIERTRDSGMELGAGCINVRVHHNLLRQTHGGLRYKVPRIGPVFIYCNVLIDGSPFNIWYSMDDSPAEGYVYHNTIIGGGAGLIYSSFETPHHLGAPNWHYLNNLVIGKEGFFRNQRTSAPVNFVSDYNVVVGGRPPYPNDPTKDTHSRYVEAVPLTDGIPPQPLPGSAAIGAGLDLSTYYHGKPLPGCNPGYFSGHAPNAGAF